MPYVGYPLFKMGKKSNMTVTFKEQLQAHRNYCTQGARSMNPVGVISSPYRGYHYFMHMEKGGRRPASKKGRLVPI